MCWHRKKEEVCFLLERIIAHPAHTYWLYTYALRYGILWAFGLHTYITPSHIFVLTCRDWRELNKDVGMRLWTTFRLSPFFVHYHCVICIPCLTGKKKKKTPKKTPQNATTGQRLPRARCGTWVKRCACAVGGILYRSRSLAVSVWDCRSFQRVSVGRVFTCSRVSPAVLLRSLRST